ncbi:MAG: hypothetical protein WBD02_01095 [Acidimicrobiia bacterium]
MTGSGEVGVPLDTFPGWSRQQWRRYAITGGVAALVVALVIALAIMFVSAQSEVHSFTIPEGTQQRVDRGEYTDLFPETLRATVGDKLVIDNQDVVTHQFGPYAARAGERLVVDLSQAGTFPGPCSVNGSKSTKIIVES